MQWQPIKTAPRDQDILLFCAKRKQIVVAGFSEYSENWEVSYGCGADDPEIDNPTHWMPLPEPPNVY